MFATLGLSLMQYPGLAEVDPTYALPTSVMRRVKGTQLRELAAASYESRESFEAIFRVLEERLDERGSKWRKCSKALQVIDYLMKCTKLLLQQILLPRNQSYKDANGKFNLLYSSLFILPGNSL
eukprot:jgi/Pico_ML_1/52611/g3291.t1